MKLTLYLCTAGSFPGPIIGAVEHDNIVHVGIGDGSGWVMAEYVQGFWGVPEEQYAKALPWVLCDDTPTDPSAYPITQQQAKTAWRWMRSGIGSAYGYVQVVADGVAALIQHPIPVGFKSFPHFGGHFGSFTCSGVIAEALQTAGWAPFAKNPRTVTPADWHTLHTQQTPRIGPTGQE